MKILLITTCLWLVWTAAPVFGSVISDSVVVENAPCPPASEFGLHIEELRIIAADPEHGPQVQRLEGEIIKRTLTCGKTAAVLTGKNLYLYSAYLGMWFKKADWLRGGATNDSYQIALGLEIAILANYSDVFFFDSRSGSMVHRSLNADHPRGAVAANDAGCLVTDRRIYCHANKFREIKVHPLYNREIKNARGLNGKITMTSAEQVILFLVGKNTYEVLGAR